MKRPYPWRCAGCGNRSVNPASIDYRGQIKHENVLHDVHVPNMPVHRCDHCGIVTVGEDSDSMIREALAVKLHLLTPAAIRACREELGMTQERFALVAGFAPTSPCRWENGAIPSRFTNNFMRAYFAVPQMRLFLDELVENPLLGEKVVWETDSSVLYLEPFFANKNTQPGAAEISEDRALAA